ncbi:MAG TPA: hypothetical protein VF115_12660 [Acidimicrobiia bacterium]
MPIITVRPPIPSYLPLLTEGGMVVALILGAVLISAVLLIVVSRNRKHRKIG